MAYVDKGDQHEGGGKVRLQRLMAECGVAARRACEQMIADGRVEVNGTVVDRLPVFVDPHRDKVVVDGRELPRARRSGRGSPTDSARGDGVARAEMARKVYVMLNKPARVLTAASDPSGRVTVNELVTYPGAVRLYPVGRLEWEATGLVLLTNDGVLANLLSHPRYGVDRVFEVEVKGLLDDDFVTDLEQGVNFKARRAAIESGRRFVPISIHVAGRKGADERGTYAVSGGGGGSKTLLMVTVKPGGTGGGAVRRAASRSRGDDAMDMPDSPGAKLVDLLGAAGVKVAKLTQVSLGPLKLVDVKPGLWRELERHEVAALKRLEAQGGGSLATSRADSGGSVTRGFGRAARPSADRRGERPVRGERPARTPARIVDRGDGPAGGGDRRGPAGGSMRGGRAAAREGSPNDRIGPGGRVRVGPGRGRGDGPRRGSDGEIRRGGPGGPGSERGGPGRDGPGMSRRGSGGGRGGLGAGDRGPGRGGRGGPGAGRGGPGRGGPARGGPSRGGVGGRRSGGRGGRG